MKRIDWLLVPPARDDSDDIATLMVEISRIVEQASESPLSADDLERLTNLEQLYATASVSPCEATGAPQVHDDPDWESRVIDEFADTDTGLELEQYLKLRRTEPDCERCPYASPYSLFPNEPCEFSAGLLAALGKPSVAAAVEVAMAPREMEALATVLEASLSDAEGWPPYRGVDVDDYIRQAVFFLRSWAQRGFSIRAEKLDELSEPIAVVDGDGADARVLH